MKRYLFFYNNWILLFVEKRAPWKFNFLILICVRREWFSLCFKNTVALESWSSKQKKFCSSLSCILVIHNIMIRNHSFLSQTSSNSSSLQELKCTRAYIQYIPYPIISMYLLIFSPLFRSHFIVNQNNDN